MKIKSLLCAAAAVLAFAACEEKVDLGPEKVEITSATALEIPVNGGSVTLEFTATVNWELQGYDEVASWLVIKPESGKASAEKQTLTISADKNEGSNRSANINIFGNVLTKAAFTVSQKGSSLEDGTQQNPYYASTALQMILDGKHDETKEVYVQGVISAIENVDIGSYGNAEYSISDDGSAENELIVYRGYYLGGAKFTAKDQIKVGDRVVVYGKLVNFNGTPEFTSGNKIYSLNGTTSAGGGEGETPTEPDAYPTAEPTLTPVTIEEFLAKPVSYTDWYKLTGKITQIESDVYGNISIEDESGKVYIYGVTSQWIGAKNDKSFASIEQLNVGDIITIGTLRSQHKYNYTPQGGGNWCAAWYISHVDGEPPVETADEIVVVKDLITAMNLTADYNLPIGTPITLSENLSVTYTKMNSSSNSKLSVGDSGLRWYKDDILKLSATKAMAKVEFETYGGSDYAGPVTADKGEMTSDLIWEGNAAEITFTAPQQVRVSKIKVTYVK